MPNIRSAKKKLRQDKKRTSRNTVYSKSVEKIVKSLHKATKGKKVEALRKAYSVLDKAVKKKIIHKNKASRLKSRISKLSASQK